MDISLNKLTKIDGHRNKAKRRGRGYGSGRGGHNSGFGTKGQKARQGRKPHAWFEGGQTPLVRRLPYNHGSTPKDTYKILILNLSTLEKISEDIKDIDLNSNKIKGLGFEKFDFVKVLGKGKIKTKINLEGFWYSKKAKEKIEKIGGSIK